MTLEQAPLYPKFSSIYNKIMQLAIAICLLVVVMNLWVYSFTESKQTVDGHFSAMSEQLLTQMVNSALLFKREKPEQLQIFIDTSIDSHVWLKDISIYDETGQLIIHSTDQESIVSLYGLTPATLDQSKHFTPFIKELRDEKLQGYIRITVENNSFTQGLSNSADKQFDLFRMMMILSGIIGFLLTRGLSRFSRQGFRLTQK